MDQSFDLPDSTDWLNSSIPGLAPLESALRCQICKDFFNNPVITSCSHTFCSLCIRRCLSAEGKCPACRSSDQELKLRRNWVVQEIVESFQNTRPNVLVLARQTQTAEVIQEEDSGLSHPAAKKRRLNEPESALGQPQLETRRTRSQGKQPENHPIPTESEIVDDSKDEDYIPDDGLVSCPMCNRRMKEEVVFNHLDTCKGSAAIKTSQTPTSNIRIPLQSFQSLRNQNPTKPLERLPTLNYSLFKETMLRKKMKELGIPDWGSRSLLQRRHTEWMNLWNANCDAKIPKTRDELRRDLDVWERTQGGAAPQSGALVGPNAVMAKNFDAAAWSTSHNDDFKILIENARKKKEMMKVQKQNEEEATNKPANQPDDTIAMSNINGENHQVPLINQQTSTVPPAEVGNIPENMRDFPEPYPMNENLVSQGDSSSRPAI